MLLAIVLVAMPLCTSAVNEGNKLFVDPIEDNSTLYYEKSDLLRYELNIDTGNTLYVKVDENRSPSTTEYIVYKMKDSIVNVEIDCMHCAGLGDGNTDISVFVSKDNVEWVEVETAATEQTFDDEIYISQDTAYWFLSTVYNVEPIEPGYTYIKIQINPFTVKGSVPWNTVMDTIRIEYGPNSGTNPPATEPPATEPKPTNPPATEPKPTNPPATEPPATEPPATEPPATEPPATEPPATEPPATEPTVTPTQPEGNKNLDDGEFPIMVVIAIVVLGGGGATAGVILWKKKH